MREGRHIGRILCVVATRQVNDVVPCTLSKIQGLTVRLSGVVQTTRVAEGIAPLESSFGVPLQSHKE